MRIVLPEATLREVVRLARVGLATEETTTDDPVRAALDELEENLKEPGITHPDSIIRALFAPKRVLITDACPAGVDRKDI